MKLLYKQPGSHRRSVQAGAQAWRPEKQSESSCPQLPRRNDAVAAQAKTSRR